MRSFAWLLALPLLGCPTPTPEPSPTPTPGPTPTPVVETCCNIPPADAEGWELITPKPPAYNTLFIAAAEAEIGSVCGAVPDFTLQRLGAALRARHICADQWVNKEAVKIDALVALRPDGLWEEWHAVAYTDGCWMALPVAYKNVWKGPQMLGGCK